MDTDAGKTLIRRASISSIAELDSIIFDVDGVLIDVAESIQLVHGMVAERYFKSQGWQCCENMVQPADVDAFKLAGGFNSDWDTASAWALLYHYKYAIHNISDGKGLRSLDPSIERFTAEIAKRGGGLQSAITVIQEWCDETPLWIASESRWDRPLIERLFQETYSGDLCSEVYGFEPKYVTGPGMIYKDRPILDRQLLNPEMRYGIATGRTYGESVVSLRLCEWSDFFPPSVIVSENDGFRKPNPKVLRLAVERIGAYRPIYIGDTPDDLLTVSHYKEIYSGMLSCMVMTGLGRPGVKEHFIEQQTDIIADNVNAALITIERCMGGK